MAVYYTDKGRSFGVRSGPGIARQIVVAEAVVAMTTAMIDNADDEVALFYLPKGAVVVGASIMGTDMDSNGSPALAIDLGDASDEDRLIAAAAVGQAATLSSTLATTGFLYQYSTDTLIKAFIKTAAATAVAGTLYVTVSYFIDPEFSRTGVTATTTA